MPLCRCVCVNVADIFDMIHVMIAYRQEPKRNRVQEDHPNKEG
jgi:hypothetical protein